MKKFIPPTLEDVERYIAENPEIGNLDAYDVWKGYDDGDWIDTHGNPVRNWKLKLRTRSKSQARFEQNRPQKKKKIKLWPLRSGEICSKEGCIMPAVYRDMRSGYAWYYCPDHMPERVKAEYE